MQKKKKIVIEVNKCINFIIQVFIYFSNVVHKSDNQENEEWYQEDEYNIYIILKVNKKKMFCETRRGYHEF